MADILSIKSAPAAEGDESPANQPNVLHITVPEGRDVEAVKAALEVLAGMVETPDEAAAKAGARHSKADADRLQQVHDHAIALGAICHDHNTPAPEDGAEGGPSKRKGAATTAAPKPAKSAVLEGEGDLDSSFKSLPLDKLVSAVRDAFWNLRTEMRMAQKPFGKDKGDYWEWDDSKCADCVAVFTDYAVARIGLNFYKVPFTLDGKVTLAPESEWEVVEHEWVTKSADLMALIAANEVRSEVGAVKALGGGRLGNYLMLWGDEQHRDLYGEYFTKETAGLKSIYDYIGKLPALYQHAMDGVVKYSPIGTIDVLEIDEVGLWMETQLDMANEYAGAVMNLAKKKALGASSGALPGSRKVRPNGEIWQWAIIEGSYTPTPAEPRLRELGVEVVKSIYAECGLEFPEEEALRSASIGGEEPRQESTDEAALEDERLRLLELSLEHSTQGTSNQ